MDTFDLAKLIGAIYASNLVILDALIAQGVVDKSALIRFVKGTIENVTPEPLLPEAHFVLSKILAYLELDQPSGKATLQ